MRPDEVDADQSRRATNNEQRRRRNPIRSSHDSRVRHRRARRVLNTCLNGWPGDGVGRVDAIPESAPDQREADTREQKRASYDEALLGAHATIMHLAPRLYGRIAKVSVSPICEHVFVTVATVSHAVADVR